MSSTNLKQRRQFYVMVGFFLLGLGFWKLYKGEPHSPYVCFAGSLFLAFLEFFVPALGAKLFGLWMKLAHLLGTVNTALLLSVIYFAVLMPLGLLKKKATKASPFGEKACRQRKSAWFDLPVTSHTAERYSSSY